MQEKSKSDQIIEKLKSKIGNHEVEIDNLQKELEQTVIRLKEVESLWQLVV